MIQRVLVANRGEIARRVFRTCRDSGITTVAVASDADEKALHAADADLVVRLAGNAPGETYLRTDLIIAAARESGADAIHPGYGFLSENAAFARAVIDAGLTWIGPNPEAIDAMGSKIESKILMDKAGVPVLGEVDPAAVTEADMPVLVKASAGGGGRGMRIVRSVDELAAAVELASNEAASAFGDPTVFCEPYIEAGRHIEVQVLADKHGNVWALGERECSIQRRHQKVIEESPSPMVDAELRQKLCDAAVAAAKAVNYEGAGTVEFLASNDGRFYFLEMNTRLQVEHPVTECVTGLDLVAWQIRIAEGAVLPETGVPAFNGHAIEVRLVAEDPAADWMPTNGPVHAFGIPGVDAEFEVPGTYGLRLDSGFGAGDAISVHYDGMLAKLIAWAPTRAEAARRLAGALAASRLHGLTTNRDLLVRVLRHPEFVAGQIDTAFFDRHGLDALAAPLADEKAEHLSSLAAALAEAAANRAAARVQAELPSGWRNVVSSSQRVSYSGRADQIDVAYRISPDGLIADGHDGVRLVESSPNAVTLADAGVHRTFTVATYPDMICVDSFDGSVTLRPIPRFPDPSSQVAAGSLLAPMPGSVVAVHVAEGETVEAGQPIVVLEAMKMQHTIAAPAAGAVALLKVAVGQQVETNDVLAVVGAGDGTDGTD
ncbi:acetyl/propionyl/methylcrotonyl-CoA carboxylase subunit alpha [Mycolicibacterium llatzerense]|uniref:acetyl/propionyl/methylcrotonyl-CoA carboxylase subunit alpha n=1 Tax=Mycolicibacterium llatzerense TaxID=280871 RepID=UPI0008DE5D9A|nr:biotin carboxylase N-terminal domain-containing protein [Mycolicibacterium llatzerense]